MSGIRVSRRQFLCAAINLGEVSDNLVRRIVNPDEEQIYEAFEDPNDSRTMYYRDGETRLVRLKVDDRGVPTEVAVAPTTAANPLTASYEVRESYATNSHGMIDRISDPQGNTRVITRDPMTRSILSVTPRLGGTNALIAYNPFKQPTSITDRTGSVTSAVYNPDGNLKELTRALGTPEESKWKYEYNGQGQITKATDPKGNVTDYEYRSCFLPEGDPCPGLLLKITAPADNPGDARAVTVFEYYNTGVLSAWIDPEGHRISYGYDDLGRLTTITYPDNTSEIRTYRGGVLDSITSRRGIVQKYDYDSSGRLKKLTEAFGHPEASVTTFEYFRGTRKPSAENHDGDWTNISYDDKQRLKERTTRLRGTGVLVTSFTWDASDRATSETDPYGRRTLYVRDAEGRATRTIRELVPNGVPAGADLNTLPRISGDNPPYVIGDVAYDGLRRVRATTDGRGYVNSYDYYGGGWLKEEIRAAGTPDERKTKFLYFATGKLQRVLHPRTFTEGPGFETSYTYTGRNLVRTRTVAPGTADEAVTTYTYTGTGNVKTEVDARGFTTTYGYDEEGTCCGRLTSVKRGGGNFITKFGYDPDGNRTTTTNALSKTWTTAYDGTNRVVTETDPLNQVTRFDYDDDLDDGLGMDATYQSRLAPLGLGVGADGSMVRITNAAGQESFTVLDGAGRPILMQHPNFHTTSTTHDSIVGGLVETVVTNVLNDDTVITTRFRSDGAGRVRQIVDAAPNVTNVGYDATGNVRTDRDPNNVGQDCDYDGLGQRKLCTDTRGETTEWEYDASGNQTAVIDSANTRRPCTFDYRDRTKTCTDGVPATTTWSWDGNSNLATIKDAQNRITTYTYNSRDLRESIAYPDSTGPTDKVSFTYDDAGRLDTTTDQAGNLRRMTYYDDDRLHERIDPDGHKDTFTYDPAGRLKTAGSTRYGTGIVRTYLFGLLDTETLSVSGQSYVVDYDYDELARVKKVTYPGGAEVHKTYTSRNQLETLKWGTTPVVTFGYDNGGRLHTNTMGNGRVETWSYRTDNTVNNVTTPSVGDFTYTYDAAKRKKTEGGSLVNGPQGFDYDDEGRLTSWSGAAGATQSWTLSAVGNWNNTTKNGVLESRNHNPAHELTDGVVGGQSYQLSYDARGNLTGDGFSMLKWDLDNQLNELRQSPAGEEVVVATFKYDALGRRVARIDSSGTTVFVHDGPEVIGEYDGSGNPKVSYILGAGIDQPVAFSRAGSLYWYSANHLATIGAVTDASGAVIERYRYDAFGERTVLAPDGQPRAASVVGNQVGFTGRYHEPTTGLIDFRFRQYSPGLGRFISRDDEYWDGMSLYGAGFVPNQIDPSGHKPPDAQTTGKDEEPPPGDGDCAFPPCDIEVTEVVPPPAIFIVPPATQGFRDGKNKGGGGGGGGPSSGPSARNATDPPNMCSADDIASHAAAAPTPTPGWNATAPGASKGGNLSWQMFVPGAVQDAASWEAFNRGDYLNFAGWQVAAQGDALLFWLSLGQSYGPTTSVRVGTVATRGGVGPVRQGAAGVQRAVADIEASGGRVLGREITIEAGGVRTRPDLFVRLPNGQQAFVEVKTGASATLTPNQSVAFPQICTGGGIPRGANASAAGLTPGTAIGPTPVWTVHYPWPLP